MSSLPSQALDCQVDLLRYYETEGGAAYADAVLSFILNDNVEDTTGMGAMLHHAALAVSDTYAISSDIIDILEVAMETVPKYTLHSTDLPSPFGFVYLERPVVLNDSFEKPLVIRAFTWAYVTRDRNSKGLIRVQANDTDVWMPDLNDNNPDHGLLFIIWTDPSDFRDELHNQFKEDEVEVIKKYGSAPPQHLWSMIGGLWTVGEEPRGPLDQFAMSFFRFCQEEWVDTSGVRPDRAASRRAQRAKFDPEPIRVIRLRRRKDHVGEKYDGPRMKYLDHRGLVSGHWRNQWYPTLGDHRPKWIRQFVKGPEGAPLRVSTRIFNVDR